MWSNRDADTPVKVPNTGWGDEDDDVVVAEDDEILKAMKVFPGDHCRT